TLLQGGFAQIAGSDYDFAAVRSLQNGDFDEQGFGAATYAFDIAGSNKNDRVRAMLIDPQGRVLIAGEAARGANGTDTDIALVRLKSNLAPDPDFGTNGRLVISYDIFNQTARDELGGIAVAPDGKILVVGTHFPGDAANVSDVALVRLEDDGDADFAFGTFGREFYDFGNGATQKDVGVDVVVTDSRVVVLSQREFDGADTDFVVFGVVNTVPPKPDPLFKNGFE
ncbi:MAG TPA: hypothetical protein VFO79_10265, partial [Xanthomonadales bacterium]|nr:hypothetical protein [Xanthomonadales bacterium]